MGKQVRQAGPSSQPRSIRKPKVRTKDSCNVPQTSGKTVPLNCLRLGATNDFVHKFYPETNKVNSRSQKPANDWNVTADRITTKVGADFKVTPQDTAHAASQHRPSVFKRWLRAKSRRGSVRSSGPRARSRVTGRTKQTAQAGTAIA